MTLADALRDAAATLADAGIDRPEVDVQWLMAHVAGCGRGELALRMNDALTAPQQEQWIRLIAGRAGRIPLQHLLGTAEFCGMEIAVNGEVLIPRPETERLAEAAWQFATTLSRPVILDFGTGSGCLAIAIAGRCPSAQVHALDVSRAAVNMAQANAKKNKVAARTGFFRGDGFAALPAELRFDLIVSNPPYIPTAEIETLEPEVRLHDPARALDGGADGLKYFRLLAAKAADWLLPGGRLMMEMGDGQSAAVVGLLAGWGEKTILRDLNNVERIVIASLPNP